MHWREYEDCKQILKLSLNLTRTLERPERQWPLPLVRQRPQTFLYGQSGTGRLSFRLRRLQRNAKHPAIYDSLRFYMEFRCRGCSLK